MPCAPKIYPWPVPQYPSIIRAHNMCYSTLVLDDAYAAVPGVEYYVIETAMGTFKFAQSPQGVLPALLDDLAAFRKQAKKDMAAAKAAGDSWTEALANGRQLAFKITMNSVYGFGGATKGMLPCVPIAASVTATGRAMIQKTKALAESLVPGSRVVYGVSGRRARAVRASLRSQPCWPAQDTDSVMVIFDLGEAKRHDMAAHFEVAERVAKEISATFKAPNELEPEKGEFTRAGFWPSFRR